MTKEIERKKPVLNMRVDSRVMDKIRHLGEVHEISQPQVLRYIFLEYPDKIPGVPITKDKPVQVKGFNKDEVSIDEYREMAQERETFRMDLHNTLHNEGRFDPLGFPLQWQRDMAEEVLATSE